MRRRFLSTNKRQVRYMTIEPLENGVYLSFGGNGLYYSIDDSEWVSLPIHTNTPSINVGQTIKIKGLNVRTDYMTSYFTINGRCKLSGTIMSIIYGDKPYEEKLPLDSCFVGAFRDCTSIVEVASDFLPATTLTRYCYAHLFFGCSNLTTAPELPATTLASDCYNHMFQYCTSLITAPELPATTLASDCYNHMFNNCSKLNYIKMLATDISASNCLYSWVSGVASTGTFVKNPNMTTLPTGTDGIPSGWTVVNDSEESGGDGDKVVNKVQLVNDGLEWDFVFDYPVNSNLQVNFADGLVYVSKGAQQSSTGYPSFDKPTIVGIDPLEDDKYIYTW